MHRLLFLSKVAFICNLFFLLTWLLRYVNYVHDPAAVSTIVVIGYFLAVAIFNPLVNIIYLVMLLRKTNPAAVVPLWLVLTNFIFLLLQLQYMLFLNIIHD
jgi:hypothetical protein